MQKIIYIPFWEIELQNLINHLESTQFASSVIEHLKDILNDKSKHV